MSSGSNPGNGDHALTNGNHANTRDESENRGDTNESHIAGPEVPAPSADTAPSGEDSEEEARGRSLTRPVHTIWVAGGAEIRVQPTGPRGPFWRELWEHADEGQILVEQQPGDMSESLADTASVPGSPEESTWVPTQPNTPGRDRDHITVPTAEDVAVQPIPEGSAPSRLINPHAATNGCGHHEASPAQSQHFDSSDSMRDFDTTQLPFEVVFWDDEEPDSEADSVLNHNPQRVDGPLGDHAE